MRTFVFDCQQDQALSLALRVAQQLRARIAECGSVRLAIGGGRSDLPMHLALSRESLDWSRVTVMLADERIVDENHEHSHARRLRETLLCERAAAAVFEPLCGYIYDQESCLSRANQRFVQPDVIVLGMGREGEIASLLPGSPEFAAAVSLRFTPGYVLITPPAGEPERITLNLSALLGARQVFLSVTGPDKLKAFASAAKSPCVAQPVSLLIHQHKVAVDVYRTQ